MAASAMQLLREIYPICRSITGDGVRRTIELLGRHAPLVRFEVPSRTPVFDWEVPLEWNVRQAYIANTVGERVVDFERHALHLMSYSPPVRARMSLDQLRPHLHTLPDHPDWIPYRTSYWREDWGFCLTQRQLDALPEGPYDVVVDTSLVPGSLTYAECRIPGELDSEFLIFTHICHPALANDNASGLAIATLLAAQLLRAKPRLSYRFVFAPATIGSITWLARNMEAARALRGGLVVGLLGDPGPLTYKRSRRGNTEIDIIASSTVRALDPSARVVDFSPYGYDERQFCSPGFDLPVGRLTRSPNGEYPQYHTSADDPDLMSADALANSIRALAYIIDRVDGNRRLRRRDARCEPRLGKHGLFRGMGGRTPHEFELALLWLLNQSDGTHGLNDIATAAELPDSVIAAGVDALLAAGLIEDIDHSA
jgi:aminopeptidase-like protein